jgi:hypothetical protein
MTHALMNPLGSEKPAATLYTPAKRHGTNIRQYLLDVCLEILLKYRQLCSPQSPKGQLILPEALKVLPLMTLCLAKHPALLLNNLLPKTPRSGSPMMTSIGVESCERAWAILRLLRGTVAELMTSLYPRLYPLHMLQDGDGYPVESDGEEVKVWDSSVCVVCLLCFVLSMCVGEVGVDVFVFMCVL